MSTLNHIFEVIDNPILTDKIRLLKVRPESQVDFKSGQYFSFKIQEKVNRSYSIASAPNGESIEFLVEIIEGGVGSNFIDKLKTGDKFDAIGPLGFFTLEKTGAFADNEPLLFLATGSGISPIRSMILDLLQNQKSSREIHLYFGLRFDDKTYFFEEFQKLSEEFPNFHFTPVISRPGDKWTGAIGHCQDCLLKNPIIPNARVYVCGSNNSVQGIIEDLINYGYSKDKIFHEKFG